MYCNYILYRLLSSSVVCYQIPAKLISFNLSSPSKWGVTSMWLYSPRAVSPNIYIYIYTHTRPSCWLYDSCHGNGSSLCGWLVDRQPLGYYCDVGIVRHECRVDPLGVQRGPLSSPTHHISTGSDSSPFPFHSRKSRLCGCIRLKHGYCVSGQGHLKVRFRAYPGGIYSRAVAVHNRLWESAHSSQTQMQMQRLTETAQDVTEPKLWNRIWKLSLTLSGLVKVDSW